MKPYIDMNTELRKNAQNYFEKNAVFGKTMEKVRKHRHIKLVRAEGRRNYLVSETIYHTFFFRKLISHRNKKNKYF